MKNVILAVIVSLTFFSCKEDKISNALQDQPSTNQSGSVSFSLDKASAPASVAAVTAELSRQGFLSVKKSLSLLSDSAAETTFDKVAIGTWTIKVNALSRDSVLLYSGQASVEVLAGVTTQVNITLMPVTATDGGINIHVTWGTVLAGWFDNATNPILRRQNTKYDTRGVGYPIVLSDGAEYKMWYANIQSAADTNGAVTSIGLATSKDGNTWTHYSQEPVLKPTPGAWDGAAIGPGTVLKDEGIYKLYYYGYGQSSVRYQVGLATSQDGVHWTKHGDPVLAGASGWEYSIGVMGVVKVSGLYYMYYHAGPPQAIGVATSQDGVNWTRYAGNPIITPTESWESSGVACGSVIYANGLFEMVYCNGSSSQSFGYATSIDGMYWTKGVGNPIFSIAKTKNNWVSGSIGYQFLTQIGTQKRIYYTGLTYAGECSIGFAYKN